MVQKIFSLLVTCAFFLVMLASCSQERDYNVIIFATSADYPPFEYKKNGNLVGFDIELANLIANKMGKKAQFREMQFSTILASVQNGNVDAAISTITPTDKRAANFTFSIPYYFDKLSIVFNPEINNFANVKDLNNKKIACQLGTTMEIWLKNNTKETSIITMDSNPQAIEAVKANHVDGALLDTNQANAFVRKNSNLQANIIASTETGYAIAFKKDSTLVDPINKIILELIESGEMDILKQKHLGAF